MPSAPPLLMQFIQPPGSLPSEVLHLALPSSCRPWLPALAWYLRQNLLTFLHSPKYTDSNSRNHFQVRSPLPVHTQYPVPCTPRLLHLWFGPWACARLPARVLLSSHTYLYPLPHSRPPSSAHALSPASTATTGGPPRLGHLLI